MIHLQQDGSILAGLEGSTSYKEFMRYFNAHVANRSFYNVPRFYIGGFNQNFNTHQLVSLSQNDAWYNELERRAVELLCATRPGHTHVREAISAAALGTSGFPFWPTNFLDAVALRVHVVLRGYGRIEGVAVGGAFKRGDVLLFEPADFGKPMTFTHDGPIVHQVLCIGSEADKGVHSWDLFAKSKVAREYS